MISVISDISDSIRSVQEAWQPGCDRDSNDGQAGQDVVLIEYF